MYRNDRVIRRYSEPFKLKNLENQMINKVCGTQGGNRTHTPERTGF